MAIIRKNLGNNYELISQKFREHYDHGLGGLAFDAFLHGWQEAWEECKKYNPPKDEVKE